MGTKNNACTLLRCVQPRVPAMTTGPIPLLAVLLVAASVARAQDCQYSYFHQPPNQLTCNPYGSRLQLQCAASGPSKPPFTVQWFTHSLLPGSTGLVFDSAPPTPILSSSQGYSVQTVAQNNGGLNEQTTSSVLTKDVIRQTDALVCFWCELVISGYQPMKSNVMCILNEADYDGVTSCSESAVFALDSSQVCMEPVPVSPPSQTTPQQSHISPASTKATTAQSASAGDPQPSSATSSDPLEESTGNSGSRVSGDGDRDTEQLQALYIAVALCAVFVVVIVVMVVAILIMCRRKPCTKDVLYSHKYMSNGNINARLRGGFSQAVSEPDLLRIQRCEVMNAGRGSKRMLKKTISLEHDYAENAHHLPQQLQLKAKGRPSTHVPQQLQLKATGRPSTHRSTDDYDHLESLHSGGKKEHFYYTLERSQESSDYMQSDTDKLQPPHASPGRVSPKYAEPTVTKHKPEGEDYEELVVQGKSELFDDPKYAPIFLKTRRKKTATPLSISSPLLNTTSRQSSRYPHSRSSDNISHIRGLQQSQWSSTSINPMDGYMSPLSTRSQPDLFRMQIDKHESHHHYGHSSHHLHYPDPAQTISVPIEVHEN